MVAVCLWIPLLTFESLDPETLYLYHGPWVHFITTPISLFQNKERRREGIPNDIKTDVIQNCHRPNNQQHKQLYGLALGTPTSEIVSGIHLPYFNTNTTESDILQTSMVL
jgi:hypothetical protein